MFLPERNPKTGRWNSVLMIRTGNTERTRYGPPNFYRWSKKAQRHYIFRSFPKATGVCNGIPWSLGGSESIYLRPL